MRVLHIYKDYYPILGGIENHVRVLAEGQVQRGLDVTVLTTSLGRRTEETRLGGVRVIRAGRLATVASMPLSMSLLAWIRRLEVAIAHLHFPYPLGEIAQLWLGRAPRLVITYHSDVVRQARLLRLYHPLLWRVLRRADRLIATSPAYIQSSPYLRAVVEKCTVIPLGIDPTPFASTDPAQVAAIRARYGPQPLLLFVGRLRYYKGLPYLFEALRRVEARLLVVGIGPLAAELRALAAQLGLADRVIFLGEVPDAELHALYHAAQVFVLPASHRSEAFGAVQLEAMAAGCPVVSTELGTGTSYVNQHGITGLVVPPRDPAVLAEAISHLLGDADLRSQMGSAARARVAAEFTAAHMVERVIALYQTLS